MGLGVGVAGPGSISTPPLLPSSSIAPHVMQALLPPPNSCLRPSGVLDDPREAVSTGLRAIVVCGEDVQSPRASLFPPAPNTPTSFLSSAPLGALPTHACCLSQESQGAPTLVHALVWVCTHIHTCVPAHTSFSPLLLLLNPTHPAVGHQGPGHGHPPAQGLYISWEKAGGAEWIWGPTGVTAKGP